MSKDFILAHDIGTSGTKSSIVGLSGEITASASFAHSTSAPGPARSEQNPEDWWTGVVRNTRSLLERRADWAGGIAAIGLSGHMLGCVPVDRSGAALRPALIHSDHRAREQFEEVDRRVGARAVYEMSGNILDPRSSLCKALWIKKNEPDIYRQTWRFLQSKDYVVARLTGNADTTDLSDASHGHFLDVNRMEYGWDVLRELGLDSDKLPVLRKGVDVVGGLCEAAARELGLPQGIPVVAGAGDGACANVGAGVVVPGELYCCLGTTAWIAGVSEKPFIDARNRLFNIVAADGRNCGVYGTVQSAGSAVNYGAKLFGASFRTEDGTEKADFPEFEKMVLTVPPGANGLVFLPYLEGERSPIWDSNARGVFFGVHPGHGRAHFLRATIEGVSLALRDVLDVFREFQKADSMRLIGGGAQSPVWREILGGACNVALRILSVRPEDATSLGAAIVAGVGVGAFRNLEEGVRSIRVTEEYPANADLARDYEPVHAIFRKLYPSLKDAFALAADNRKH
jgi:xylulokinase